MVRARGAPLVSFFFNDTAAAEIYPLSLHDALPILPVSSLRPKPSLVPTITVYVPVVGAFVATHCADTRPELVHGRMPWADSSRIQDPNPPDTAAPSPMLRKM